MRIRIVMGLCLAALVVSALLAAASAWATSYGVMAWGARTTEVNGLKVGQLGNGGENGSSAPVAVSGLSEVADISSGSQFSLALLANGTVKSWGENTFGQLGTGSIVGPEVCEAKEGPCAKSPVAVGGLTGVTAVSGGDAFGLALLENGKVMAWGDNEHGVLGNGTTTGPEHCKVSPSLERPCSGTPTAVKGLSEVTAISAGKGFALALLSNGKVMAWGNNEAGELGDGTTTSRSEPVEVQGLSGVVAISAGYNEGLALLSNGKVMAWGGNVHAQLGTGETSGPESCGASKEPCSRTPLEVQGLSEVVEISAGYWNEIARLSNGSVRTWGNNGYGELGIGNHTGPEYCPAAHVACSAKPLTVEGLGGTVASVSASEFSEVLARMSSGTVMSWGYNNEGQVGGGDVFGPESCGEAPFEACDSTPGPVVGLADAAGVASGFFGGLAMVPVASPPEFGRCIKVEAETGKYASGGCSKEGGEGKFEWYSAVAKKKFTTTGGSTVFEQAPSGVMHCNSESGAGEYSGQKAVSGLVMRFHECSEPFIGSCSTAGAAAGEVVTSALTGTLGVEKLSGEGPSENKIALSLSPAGGVLFEATCGSSPVTMRGSVLAPVKSNLMVLTPKVKFKATFGIQQPQEFEGGPKEVLEASFLGHPFAQTGLTVTIEQANEEKVEISSVA